MQTTDDKHGTFARPTCSGTDLTEEQSTLKERHGTPLEFSDAIWQACNDLFITTDEAVRAIRDYRDEWNAAGKSPNAQVSDGAQN